jgi:hypothetical protein
MNITAAISFERAADRAIVPMNPSFFEHPSAGQVRRDE